MPAPTTVKAPLSLPALMRANRNMLLFCSVILMIVLLPIFSHTRRGEVAFAVVNGMIIGAAALSNGSSRRLYWLAVAVAIPSIAFSAVGIMTQTERLGPPAWVFGALVHFVTIARILHEILHAKSITRDRLFGCANVYLLLGVAWCYLYALLEHFSPGSLPGCGERSSLHAADMIYFSFNMVTGVGLTDIVPADPAARSLVLLEQLSAVLYMAFVISRLVGMYTPNESE